MHIVLPVNSSSALVLTQFPWAPAKWRTGWGSMGAILFSTRTIGLSGLLTRARACGIAVWPTLGFANHDALPDMSGLANGFEPAFGAMAV
jgi:spore coat protein U-like protein